MNVIDQAGELRMRIEEQKVGAPVPDNIWRELVVLGAVAQVLAGEQTEDWLTDRVLNLAPSLLRTKADPMLPRRQLGERQALFSQLIARQAAGEDDVQSFRRDVLKLNEDRLMAMDQVGAWISQRTAAPTRWLEIALPTGFSPILTANGVGVTPPLTISEARPVVASVDRRLLAYMQPDGWVRHVATAHGTSLDQLRKLSEYLAAKYGWHRAQATMFVLTGLTPLLRAIRLDWTRTGRLLLDVDPGVSPQQLVAAYRTLRRRLVGGRRARALTEKQQRIAAFLAVRPVSESWADRRRAWNRAHPHEAYPSNRGHNFKRECENVEKRLLNPIDEARAGDILKNLLDTATERHEGRAGKQEATARRRTPRRSARRKK